MTHGLSPQLVDVPGVLASCSLNIMPSEATRDWYVGDDPGATAFAVFGSDGVMLTGTTFAWTLRAYDQTLAPETAITPDTSASGSGTGTFFLQSATAVLDGYWTYGGTGYNWRTYLANAHFVTTPLLAGHEYRFVWTVTTATYDATANKFGTITIARRGRCLPRI